MEEDNRVIRVTRLVNGEHVIYERNGPFWKDPLLISTQRDESGKAYLIFGLFIMYSDVDEIDPLPDSACLCTYTPGPEVIKARDQFLSNYHMERQSQKEEKTGKPKWNTDGKITPLH